jgi:hypothetical protein
MKTVARHRDKAEIIRRLRTVRPEAPALWGRMSAHQMICHLADSTRVAIGQKTVSAASGVLQRTVVKCIALYLPVKWPPGIPTRPEVDQHVAGSAPGDFAADVAELEALFELMTTKEKGFSWPDHPIFGGLSRGAWLRWGYLHMDHHLRQFGA